jgi:hypothetical protein
VRGRQNVAIAQILCLCCRHRGVLSVDLHFHVFVIQIHHVIRISDTLQRSEVNLLNQTSHISVAPKIQTTIFFVQIILFINTFMLKTIRYVDNSKLVTNAKAVKYLKTVTDTFSFMLFN